MYFSIFLSIFYLFVVTYLPLFSRGKSEVLWLTVYESGDVKTVNWNAKVWVAR